jgi:glycosyltransferase involved in cell wall biosynthesis
MHVVMLAPFGIRPKGTLQVRMLPLAQALTRRGWRVTIVAPPVHNPEDAQSRQRYDGVDVVHVPSGGAATLTTGMLRAALAERPDLLHLFKPKGYGGLAVLPLPLLRRGLPLLVDSDDWEGWGGWNDLAPYPRWAKQLFAWQERDLPRRAVCLTVASRALETLAWSTGLPRERVFYLPNGSPPARGPLPAREDARRTLGLGAQPQLLLYTRFWEFPVAEVVQVLLALRQRCPTARLLVIGKGERREEEQLASLAARAGLAEALDYRGWAEPDDIPRYLAAADLALYPIADTLLNRAKCPVKLLELMAAGLPVVAGRVGQVAEYLDGGAGVLVPPGQAGAMARAALDLLGDEPRRAALGQLARERALAQFSWDAMAPVAEQAYWRALGR